MERDWLEAQLTAGRSVESIAREVGKHPSTVGYWVGKHELLSLHSPKHAARGAIGREMLVEAVEAGLTLQQMAEQFGVGATTVRHWLRKYELKTARARSWGTDTRPREILRECRHHGFTLWIRSGSGRRYRCKRCRTEHVSIRRRKVKQLLVNEAGGGCRLCGYDRYVGALQFHHVDPTTKSFAQPRVWPGPSRRHAQRRENASSSARTVMPK